ncbi:MAG: hypothetical protein IPL96_05795 [Holophagaceae bacterium]|nr:hypothetical protein [Holophagaceae bacterium]
MAKPNYAFAKRQRDLAKKQAKEEKLQRKREAAAAALAAGEPVPVDTDTDGDEAPDAAEEA